MKNDDASTNVNRSNQQAERLQSEITELASRNEKLLDEYDENSELALLLIER